MCVLRVLLVYISHRAFKQLIRLLLRILLFGVLDAIVKELDSLYEVLPGVLAAIRDLVAA